MLAIDVERLDVEVRFEAPAPIAGGGDAHLAEATTFPHVYGPIDRAAVTQVGTLVREGGRYGWPRSWHPLDEVLASL